MVVQQGVRLLCCPTEPNIETIGMFERDVRVRVMHCLSSNIPSLAYHTKKYPRFKYT